ncbi:hypothetical protein COBT_002605, partial [Conglomerata obtusa]
MSKRSEKCTKNFIIYEKRINEIVYQRRCKVCKQKMKLKSNIKTVICRNYKCRLTETLLKSKVINFSKLTIQETLRVIEMIFACALNKLIS